MQRSRVIAPLLLIAGGLVLALVLIEVGLRLTDLRIAANPGDTYRRMHYVYTETGLGKCYPTDPRDYFPHDLRRQDDLHNFGGIITDVTDLPEHWPLAEKVRFLADNAPHCNNIELVPLNSGPAPERAQKALIIGDSFAFGEGLRLEDTIGFALADRFPEVNFANMAWPGASIETIYDVADTPDDVHAVLYFYNINDLARTDALKERRDHLHDAMRERERRGRGAAAAAACGRIYMCRLVRQRQWELQRSRSTVDYYLDIYFGDENRQPRQASFDRIGEMAELLSARGIRFVLVMFPLYYKAPLAEYPFRDIHRLVAEELAARGVDFIDLLPAFDRHPWWHKFTVHPLDRHPSARAIRLTADVLRGEYSFEDG